MTNRIVGRDDRPTDERGDRHASSCGPERTGSQNSAVAHAACIDVETTGLDPDHHEIIELGIALFSFERDTGQIIDVVDHYTGMREPGCAMSPEAEKVHGLTVADLAGKSLETDRIHELMNAAEFVVAHNTRFDRPFVEALFPFLKEKVWCCSMDGIPWKAMGFPSKGLQNLAVRNGIPAGQAHRALDDVLALIRLLSQKGPDDTPYFKWLIQGSSSRYGC